MCRRGILYDQNEAGSYLQLYTESFADRFFFEIVERVDRYDQYGAANAPPHGRPGPQRGPRGLRPRGLIRCATAPGRR